MSDVGGIPCDEAWVVTEGWSHDLVMVFPDKDSASAYVNMTKITNPRVVSLRDHIRETRQKLKRKILEQLDREWAVSRNSVTWEE